MRVEEPSHLSRDAPLSGPADTSIAFRIRLGAIAGEAQFGRFSLQPSQIPPMTLFMPLQALQKHLERPARINTLLVAGDGTPQRVDAALRKHWKLVDADLELREIPGRLELRTNRVFLQPHIAETAKPALPGAVGVLTYLVTELRLAERATPYSIVTATEIAGLGEHEIIINSWLADDLGAKVGDELTLKYFVVAGQRNLREKSRTFRISEIKSLESPETFWTPPFPGISDVENCRDWEPGIPIDTSRLRPKDEDYWDEFRGTPKAFVSLEAGQQIWGNRFGNLTAIHYPPSQSPAELERVLLGKIDPAQVGLTFEPVRDYALAAARDSMDFGQLFIGFSFFLIAAALLLMAMLFVFNLEQRSEETGLLLALGFRPTQVKRVFMLEGIAVVALGTLAGVIGRSRLLEARPPRPCDSLENCCKRRVVSILRPPVDVVGWRSRWRVGRDGGYLACCAWAGAPSGCGIAGAGRRTRDRAARQSTSQARRGDWRVEPPGRSRLDHHLAVGSRSRGILRRREPAADLWSRFQSHTARGRGARESPCDHARARGHAWCRAAAGPQPRHGRCAGERRFYDRLSERISSRSARARS